MPSGVPVPTGLTVTPVGRSRLDVTWNAVPGAAGYELERDGFIVASPAGTSYSDVGLATGSVHTYRVRTAVSPNAPGKVTTTRSTTFRTVGSATGSRASLWDVRVPASATRATTWGVLSSRTATRATTWDDRATRTQSRATSWNVTSGSPGPSKASVGGLSIRGDGSVDTVALSNNNPADHVFLKASWAAISPNTNPATGGTYNWSVIDNALAAAPSAKFTLRIQAGDTAPGWLKTLVGSVQMRNQSRGLTVDVCRWWDPRARAAWVHMINVAGARYDSHPRVTMVSADLCMVVYSEPYILGGDNASAIAAYNAGLNVTNGQQSIVDNVTDTAAAFPNTMVELAIHDSFQYATPTGVGYSWPIGRSLALNLATTFGPQLCLTDYGLSWSDDPATHIPTGTINTENDVYAWMKLRRFGGGPWAGPIGFQATLKKGRSGAGLVEQDYIDFCNNAAGLGGQHAETASFGTMSLANRTAANNALKANEF